ncbi:Uma2 family endonuclease [Spirulina sp. CCNP1310]|uniref:Uma2 family endonuclease n=1 Tax=Spirulina sp. CCNP1310 TaxID=3110249 RepID=UPI002B21CAC7|nr:Uma2 family endonuclease [Spirulina sp. CCNP1310]MEA5420825.1 Uma2 family endonuclease [Spirulina sp. CCNP1310]
MQTPIPYSPKLITGRDNEETAHSQIPTELDISHLVTEDETPVDNLIQEKLQRLLVHCLYHAFLTEQPFIAMADVGLFSALHGPPLVPDVMLSLGVEIAADWSQKRHRSYFIWEFGKPPDVAIEIVSNRQGGELGGKLTRYARIGIPYYVVFDPLEYLSERVLHVYGLREGSYDLLEDPWLPGVGLGLTLWSGAFEGKQYDRWLRWCDRQGHVLLTGSEQSAQEAQRAEQEAQRAKQEAQRAEQEAQRANSAEAKLAALMAKLAAQGIDPDEMDRS